METVFQAVERHYAMSGILDKILRGLRESGKDVNNLQPVDLAPADAFHVRGREGTVELAELARIKPEEYVLDLGCGIGGSSRFLTYDRKAKVVGIDLTHEFINTAVALTELVGLDGSVRFQQGSALDLPFVGHTFDVVWTEHVQMNIADKRQFYSEAARVLKPGGRLAFHDIFLGPTGDPYYPAPWATDRSISFLARPDEVRAILEELGFTFHYWEDKTRVALDWVSERMEQTARYGPPPLSVNAIVGESAKEKFSNVNRGLAENRLAVIMAVATKN